MKGQDEIIRMRMNGLKPEWVHIYDFPYPTDWLEQEMTPSICTDNDLIKTLDMRFLINLKVCVSSCSEKRAMALFEACKQAKVTLVAAAHVQTDKPTWKQDGWTGIYNAITH